MILDDIVPSQGCPLEKPLCCPLLLLYSLLITRYSLLVPSPSPQLFPSNKLSISNLQSTIPSFTLFVFQKRIPIFTPRCANFHKNGHTIPTYGGEIFVSFSIRGTNTFILAEKTWADTSVRPYLNPYHAESFDVFPFGTSEPSETSETSHSSISFVCLCVLCGENVFTPTPLPCSHALQAHRRVKSSWQKNTRRFR
jgi:hypothetical protein